MYSMPIVGTNSLLYFPNLNKANPIVIGSVRKNGSTCDKFSDVNKRYYTTEHKNQLAMIPEKDKQRAIDHVNKLEADAPYKDIFNATKNTVNKGLNIAGLAMAARDLPALAKAGFAKIKDLNMALKSLGIDTKFIDQGLEVVENCSKKVTGKLSKEAEELSEAIKNFFGVGKAKIIDGC